MKNADGHRIFTQQKADTIIFYSAEHQPEFPGGIEKFSSYLAKNIKYPEENTSQMQGRIIVQMIIEKDGSIIRIKID